MYQCSCKINLTVFSAAVPQLTPLHPLLLQHPSVTICPSSSRGADQAWTPMSKGWQALLIHACFHRPTSTTSSQHGPSTAGLLELQPGEPAATLRAWGLCQPLQPPTARPQDRQPSSGVGRRVTEPHVACSCGPGTLLLLLVLPEVVADDNLAAWSVLRTARGPEKTSLNQKNKCVSLSSSSKPAAAELCPIKQARLQPGRDSPQVALAAVRRADVVPEIWRFSAVTEHVPQLLRHGWGRAPARRLGAAFPTPGAIPAGPAQDSWPGWGEARSRHGREAPKGCEGVAVAGQDTLRPPPAHLAGTCRSHPTSGTPRR